MSDVYKLGKKIFTVGVVVTTILWSLGVAALVPDVANAAACSQTFAAGDMIKVTGKPAIYAVNKDQKVMYFPTGDEFKSWNVNNTYGGYISVTMACFDSLLLPTVAPLSVNFRAGSYVVKRPSSDQLYVVLPSNTLSKISDTDAKALYGASYKVMTVGDASWPSYVNRGADIAGKVHDGMLISKDSKTWYVDGNKLREVTAAGMTANRFKTTFVHSVPAAYTDGLTTGDQITALVSTITNRTQDGDISTPAPTTGTLSVTLAADTPAAATVPQKATGVTFLKFNVKAGSAAATVTDVVLKRFGVGAYDDLLAVYLYDGATRLTTGKTIASDTNKVIFSNLKLALAAGESKTLSAVVDMETASPSAGNQDGLEVVEVNGGAVTGVAGNTMGVGGAAVSAVTVDNSGSSGTFRLGATGVEVGRGTINAGSATYDVKVKSLTLTNAGSLTNTYLTNLKLTIGSTDVATVAAMTNDKVVFTLATPLVITKGDTKTFTVYADNTGGRVDDTVKFYTDELSDVGILDAQFGYGVTLTDNWASGDQTYTVTGGDLTLANNGPASGNIGKNVTNVVIQKYSFSATNAVTIKSTKLYIYVIDAAGNATSSATLYNYVKNVKIVDLDNSNATVVGPEAAIGTNGTADGNSYFKTFTDAYSIAAGKTRHFAVVVDIDTNAPTSMKVYSKVDHSVASTVKYDDNSQYVAATAIVPNTLTGNQMTISGAQITVSRATPPASATVVKGSTQNALGMLITAGTSDAIKITSLKLRVYASTTAFGSISASEAGDTAANTTVNTVALYEDGASTPLVTKNLSDLSGTIGSGGYYYVQYSSLNYSVAAGDSKKLVAVLGLKDSMTATRYVAVGIDPDDDMDVETQADGRAVTENTTSNINASSLISLTVTTGGSVTVAVDGTTPLADISVTGSSAPVSFTTYKLTSSQEAFTLVGAVLTTNNKADVDKVTLTYKNKAGTTVTKEGYFNSDGDLTFSDGALDMYIEKDKSALLTVGSYINTVANGATSGDAVKIGLKKTSTTVQWSTGGTVADKELTNGFIVLGEASNAKKYGATDDVLLDNTNVTAQTVRKTKVTAAESDAGGVTHTTKAQDAIGVFTFTSTAEPSSAQNSTLNSLTVSLSGNLIASSAGDHSVTLNVYNGSTFDAAHLMGTATITGVDTAATTAVSVSLTAQNEWSGTKQVYMVVDTTDTDFSDSANNTEKVTFQLVNFRWNDGVGNATPVTGVPLYGKTYQY
ncbi:hypothetical protein EPN28_03760 [Patescibacteria group bacterium]|nr:MAG: hypothetical protein EPN28_03760 [Patescibacteria group bacterium]